jgi:hypothetical protein
MRLVLLSIALCCGCVSAEDLSFRLYQIGGRSWTIKMMPGAGGDGNLETNYTRYEVLEVHEDYALVNYVRLDKNKKIPKGVTATEFKVSFNPELPPFKQPEGSQNLGVETVKVAGLSFECDIWSSGNPPSKYYYAKRYPGLLVRTSASFGTDELCEFDAFKEDEPPAAPKKGAKPPKDPPKEETPKEPDEFALFKAKHSWVLVNRTATGAASYRKYEVLKWDDTGADVKWTELDESKRPIKGGKTETSRVEFKAGEGAKFDVPEGASKSRVEKRRYGSGVMECTVYNFKQDGKDAQIWISNQYPGLTVRITIDSGKAGISELVEFK